MNVYLMSDHLRPQPFSAVYEGHWTLTLPSVPPTAISPPSSRLKSQSPTVPAPALAIPTSPLPEAYGLQETSPLGVTVTMCCRFVFTSDEKVLTAEAVELEVGGRFVRYHSSLPGICGTAFRYLDAPKRLNGAMSPAQ